MDLENQKRVKEFADEYGAENVVVLVGAAEGEAAGLAAETVSAGDPTFAGPLAGVSLGLACFHVCEPAIKEEFDEGVYEDQVSMMEMVLDVDDICAEMEPIREEYCQFLQEYRQINNILEMLNGARLCLAPLSTAKGDIEK